MYNLTKIFASNTNNLKFVKSNQYDILLLNNEHLQYLKNSITQVGSDVLKIEPNLSVKTLENNLIKHIEFSVIKVRILSNLQKEHFLKIIIKDLAENPSVKNIVYINNKIENDFFKLPQVIKKNLAKTCHLNNIELDTIIFPLDSCKVKSLNKLKLRISSNYYKNLIGGGSIGVLTNCNQINNLLKILALNPPIITHLYISEFVMQKMLYTLEHKEKIYLNSVA